MNCYSDFKYAQSAIDLNAFGYISKPISSDKLIKIISKTIDICASENIIEKERQEMLFK